MLGKKIEMPLRQNVILFGPARQSMTLSGNETLRRAIVGRLALETSEKMTRRPEDASLRREKLVALVASTGRRFSVGYGTIPSENNLDDALVLKPFEAGPPLRRGNASLLRDKLVA
ncbi:hypothetical protein RHMOL_Rhmol11G0032400 [Rhododendron molle]|uniref:Uncharacterized protein n=1 Tax=Rhododendron molle TaxID=49168 RepID=A0ACC0LP91_RHOML|nr:hypothetical protein RHMOL_Rhmol11G0032400 [Rhododendron molle]